MTSNLNSGAERSLAAGLLVLRLFAGFALIYGVADNILSWERMLEFRDFLANLGLIAPLLCAILSVGAQFTAGLLFIFGYKIRWASALMLINFAVAIVFAHWGQSFMQILPAAALWAISLSLLLTGPGALSLDERRAHVSPREPV